MSTMTLISDEAKRAAFYELNDVASMARVEAALTAALPHIVEGVARGAEAECAMNEAEGVRGQRRPGEDAVEFGVRMRDAEAAARYLRSLAPMGEKA